MAKKLLEVVIDRTRWGTKALLNPNQNNKMCCLGFVGKKCGLIDHNMRDIEYLHDTRTKSDARISGLFIRDRRSHRKNEERLVKVNDSTCLTQLVKERRIITIGRDAGIKFRFIN